MRANLFTHAVLAIAMASLTGCATRQQRSSSGEGSTSESMQSKCIFCEIASGKIQNERVVYRDKTVVAFMDRAPRNPGHVLVIPRKHAKDMLEAPPSTLAHMAEVAQRIAKAIQSTDLRAGGFNFSSNTGAAAGQTVFHLHLHVIPRFVGEPPARGEHDGIRPSEELNAVAAMIRAKLN